MASVFVISSTVITYILVLVAVLCFISSFQLLVKNFELKHARKVFWQFNVLFLSTVILVTIDVMLEHAAM